jgi:hypothetical protein
MYNGQYRYFYKQPTDLNKVAHERSELARAAVETSSICGICVVPLCPGHADDSVLLTQYIQGDSLFNYLWNNSGAFCFRPFSRLSP